jgi:hypothetical protein
LYSKLDSAKHVTIMAAIKAILVPISHTAWIF